MEDYCQICGEKDPELTKRCPECKRIGCEDHFEEYHYEEFGLTQNLCERCRFRIRTEQNKINEIKRKKEAYFWIRVLGISILVLSLFWVVRWTLAR